MRSGRTGLYGLWRSQQDCDGSNYLTIYIQNSLDIKFLINCEHLVSPKCLGEVPKAEIPIIRIDDDGKYESDETINEIASLLFD